MDSEHALLMKGKLSGHQFEPLLEASIAELESIGLGKTPKELYLKQSFRRRSALTSVCSTDEKEPGGSATLRGPKTWEEAHEVVLEYEHSMMASCTLSQPCMLPFCRKRP